MRKSNKLLLGGFLTVLLLIIAMHVSIYARYKNGHYIVDNGEAELAAGDMHSFTNTRFVTIRDLSNAIISFSDAARICKNEDAFEYVQHGDTLVIKGKEQNRGQSVSFSLPYNVNLSAVNATLYFKAGKTAPNNPVINLQHSSIVFSGSNRPMQFGNMKLSASDHSEILFDDDVAVDSLDLQLSKSSIRYNEGHLQQLSIATDSASRLSLQSKYLLNAKIRTINN